MSGKKASVDDELMNLRIAVSSLQKEHEALLQAVANLKLTLEQNNIHYEPPAVYTDIYR